ncbi:MAG TPA: hypothetical protein VF789_14605 [Thermoanaerobaculia bacterium]
MIVLSPEITGEINGAGQLAGTLGAMDSDDPVFVGILRLDELFVTVRLGEDPAQPCKRFGTQFGYYGLVLPPLTNLANDGGIDPPDFADTNVNRIRVFVLLVLVLALLLLLLIIIFFLLPGSTVFVQTLLTLTAFKITA